MREAMLTKLARITVRSFLKPALQPSFSIAVQRRWASIAARTLRVPFGVRFSRSSMGEYRQRRYGPSRTQPVLQTPCCSSTVEHSSLALR
jgi:hypothetical protein